LSEYKYTFNQGITTRTLFGYLDHPFSVRYTYGWPGEATRIEMHRRFIGYIRKRAQNLLILSEEDILDFLLAKSEWQVEQTKTGFCLREPRASVRSGLVPTIEYAGNRIAADACKIAA
jgi:hypothetical protein